MEKNNVNLPSELLTRENLINLRELVKNKDRVGFKKTIDDYLRIFEETNGTKPEKERRSLAISYIGTLCLIADRGYITLGIPYPPAKIGSVEKEFLRVYEPDKYKLVKRKKWNYMNLENYNLESM